MASRRTAQYELSIEDLDRELIARGAQIPREELFKFKDSEGTPARDTVMACIKELYDSASSSSPNPALAAIDSWELVRLLFHETRQLEEKRKRGIWYKDHRMDFNGITDERVKKNLNSVAAIMLKDDLIDEKNGFSRIKVKKYGDVFNLNEIESFYDQPISSGRLWSGFLVKKDIIATAGHCVRESTLKDLRIVFGYNMFDSKTSVTQLSNENIYNCVKIISLVYTPKNGADWALLQLDREVQGQEVAALSTDKVVPLQPVYVIGHPVGLPLKYAGGARVRRVGDTLFLADLDLYMGNSGSPVFNSDTHEVIGIVIRDGTVDFRWTQKGWLSIVYPSRLSSGSQCTRVSEFIDLVNKGSGKPVIYNLTIEPTGKESHFHITWHNPETNTKNSFDQEAEIKPGEIQKLWYKSQYQLPIGEKLFRFLDGDDHHFQQALDKANQQVESLQVNLRTCQQTDNWPFELLAENSTFLLPQRLHLVRYVSDRDKGKIIPPKDRPLKLLFMACSPMDQKPELDFEREEEDIFHITEKLAVDMEVEDSGSLEGLRSHLEREQYDVVYLSGFAGIDENGSPYFIMEDEKSYQHKVFPDELWNEALIENPPRLLFLSGGGVGAAPSFERLLVEKYHAPMVLGWGGPVSDGQAIHAGKMLFHELGHGKSILDAVQRTRYELLKGFSLNPAWPLLRLFSSGVALNAIVKKGQRLRPKPRRIKHVFLENSRVQVLAEGFVGRRRQLQTSLHTLERDFYKAGVLLLGTAGLGKSCLAGKICERFKDHILVAVNGKFNAITLETALKDAFIMAQDEKGQHVLSQKAETTKKLVNLCATSFKDKNYLLLLDGFDQNLEGADKGQPGPLMPEAADLLKTLLHYLQFSGKMTHLIIASRYDFSLTEQSRNLVEERLEEIWLTGFRESEQRKKARELTNIFNHKDGSLMKQVVSAGYGNPRLMDWLDVWVGQTASTGESELLAGVKKKQEDFIREHLIREVLQQGGDRLVHFLSCLSIYRLPFPKEAVKQVAEKVGVETWKELLRRGVGLSLVEYDQARQSYLVTPLLREELLKSIKEKQTCNEAALAYYQKACDTPGSPDPTLVEELVFHSVGYGQENADSKMAVEILGQEDKYSTEDLEDELRRAVEKGLYSDGKRYLQEIIKISSESREHLKKEFGYIYNFEKLDKDGNNWKQKEAQINWRRKLWRVLSLHSNFEFIIPETTETQENIQVIEKEEPGIDEKKSELKVTEKKNGKDVRTSEKKGEELEKAAFILFKQFFERCEQEEKSFQLKNARQQDRGRQSGHDLKFVIGTTGDRKIRILVECKNVSKKITKDDIGGKLLAAKAYHQNIPIDHWILVSPNANVSNELDELLELWEKVGEYPFKVQAWTPASRVQEFFGLNLEIYEKFIKKYKLKIPPKDWNLKTKQEVLESWKQKLAPPLRLPEGWGPYLHNPHNLMLEPKEAEFEKRYSSDDYVEINCKDETGALLPQTLEGKVLEWIEEPVSDSPTLFLLGEFGDGKTFFTYILTRKLIEKFKQSPKDQWLPVRFALKNFESEGFKSPHAFLQRRLKDFRTDVAGWNELRGKGYKLLAILDGFDEISKELDPETIQRNIDILIDCFENDYFSGMKLLITSRKHFFESHKEKDWLMDKLDNPRLLHLAPIDRKTTEDYLREYAIEIGEEIKFTKLIKCHDPIGMASKPLFLDMVQASLKDLPEEDLNEYILYETYIQNSLKRKRKYHYDKSKRTPKDKIIENCLYLMEVVARTLHQFNREFVYLSDIRGNPDLKEWLWELSDPDKKTTEDETARTATRSLLKRIEVKDKPCDKEWPVDFCHRSIREYFVARAVCNLVETNLEEAEAFLKSCFLSHEILFFAGEIMKSKAFDYEANLLHLIKMTRIADKIKRINPGYLGGNAVNLLYRYKGKLPGKDWSNLILDGAILPYADLSGKDFSGTSLRFANLDNVNFADSNFTGCDLTEVRIEETAPVESIAISTDKKILALYRDGIIREWSLQAPKSQTASNLAEDIKGEDIKLIAQPGNDLTVFEERYLKFFDRIENRLELKASIETKPGIRLIKTTRDYLLLNEKDGKQNRLHLVNLPKQVTIRTIVSPPFTLCDHLDDHAFIVYNQNEELKLIDITSERRKECIISTGEKIACMNTCQCRNLEGHYLLGLGLYNGTVQIWQIQVDQWKYENVLKQLLHKQKNPIKDISFIDECHIVSGGLDKTIKLLPFDPEKRTCGEPLEFKMTLQCREMKIDGVTREKEKKKLQELIAKATDKVLS